MDFNRKDLLSRASQLRTAAEQIKMDSVAKVNQLLGAADAVEALVAEGDQNTERACQDLAVKTPPVFEEVPTVSNNGHQEAGVPQ
jgi:hypothetical protein